MNDEFKDRKLTVVGEHKTSVFRQAQNQLLREAIADVSPVKSVLNIGACQDDHDKEGEGERIGGRDQEEEEE